MEIKQGSNITVNINWQSLGIQSIDNISFLSVIFETYEKFPCCGNITNCQNINECNCNNYQNYNQLPHNMFGRTCDCCTKQHTIILDNYRYCDNKNITESITEFPTFVFPEQVQQYCGEYKIILTVVYKKGVIYKQIIDFGIQFVLTRNNNMENSDVTITLEGQNPSSVTSYIKSLKISCEDDHIQIEGSISNSGSNIITIPQVSPRSAGVLSIDSWNRIENILNNWHTIPTGLVVSNDNSDGSMYIELRDNEEGISDNVTIPTATTEKNGVMSFEDKKKLDELYKNINSSKGKIVNNTLIL